MFAFEVAVTKPAYPMLEMTLPFSICMPYSASLMHTMHDRLLEITQPPEGLASKMEGLAEKRVMRWI